MPGIGFVRNMALPCLLILQFQLFEWIGSVIENLKGQRFLRVDGYAILLIQ